MDRYIYKDSDGIPRATRERINGRFIGDKDIYNRLYEYEQTGLEPSEIFELKNKSQERHHGKWIFKRFYHEAQENLCSLCGQLMTTHINLKMNFCPNCGAKMEDDLNE